ncbi:MAG: hypothetical protein E7351_03745 [Clostridiales bacterium]|nr:hypothetical protein [Clostridiales bacterium]
MAIAMVAMLAFGGTYAYFTATSINATTGEKISTATIKLGAFDGVASIAEAKVVSGEAVVDSTKNTITVSNESDVDSWVFVKVKAEIDSEEVTQYLAQDAHTALTGTEVSGLYLNVGTGWTEFADGWWGKADKVAKETDVTFPVTVKYYGNSNFEYNNETSAYTENTGSQMGQKVELKFEAKAIQHTNVATLTDAATALSISAKS